jgi:gas vesicle protein
MSEKCGNFIKGLVVGGLIGAALGILYAPKSGKETRDDIARKTEELVTKAKEEYEKALEKSKAAYESAVKHLKDMELSAKEKVEEVESKVSEYAHQGAEILQDNKTRLKKALDAGVEAYREEKSKKPV